VISFGEAKKPSSCWPAAAHLMVVLFDRMPQLGHGQRISLRMSGKCSEGGFGGSDRGNNPPCEDFVARLPPFLAVGPESSSPLRLNHAVESSHWRWESNGTSIEQKEFRLRTEEARISQARSSRQPRALRAIERGASGP